MNPIIGKADYRNSVKEIRNYASIIIVINILKIDADI